jgi:hypothetical protein
MPTHPHQWITLFLDKRHFPGTFFDRRTPLQAEDDHPQRRPDTAKNTAKTGQEFRLYTPGSAHYIDDGGGNLVH